jgi:hypothetical protein
MALTIKHTRANHTHENEQFRRVANSLKLLFDKQGWEGILIGNPYSELYSRFRADAILLYNYGLFIVDFKVYNGTLKLPPNRGDFEMTQWYAESDKDKKRTLIKAGNRFINPYKQLHSYREAFKEIVKNEIALTGAIHESKTCAVNIFSGPLEIKNAVPKEIPFYKVVQESELGTLLYDYASDNKYTPEIANYLTKLFGAEDWQGQIPLPVSGAINERTIRIDSNVEKAISEFVKSNESGILVLESMAVHDRDSWVNFILSESSNMNIPQVETWVHSARIGRKISSRLGIELQSLYNTIYGGRARQNHDDTSEAEETQDGEHLQEIIGIRTDDSIDEAAVIILHEAHLVSRSLHQSELLRFGSGRLLEDLIKFLTLKQSKRKLICVGDPYSLTYGKGSDSAISVETLSELFEGKVSYYRQVPIIEDNYGKQNLRSLLANSIQTSLFQSLLSIARPESPCLPPVRLLALPSIAVAGPSAPCSIAPCRRTSPPGSNSPATAGRALAALPMSNVSSAGISNVAFSRMVLPATTRFSS